jgi:hypothetical protein
VPYIKPELRAKFDPLLDELIKELRTYCWVAGDFNYVVTRLAHAMFKYQPCYNQANAIVGALECAKQEFYRRVVAPYEEHKIIENGDVI